MMGGSATSGSWGTHARRSKSSCAGGGIAEAEDVSASSSSNANSNSNSNSNSNNNNYSNVSRHPDNSTGNKTNEATPTAQKTGGERRSSKRQRGAAWFHRYSPGEGGGLAPSSRSKRPNMAPTNHNGNGRGIDGGTNSETTSVASVNAMGISGGSSGESGGQQKRGAANNTLPRHPREWSQPSYRWIDQGANSIAAAATPSSLVVEHRGLEIDFTHSRTASWTPPPPFVVRPGDVVLLTNGGVPWDEHALGAKNGNTDQGAKREVVPLYDDPASREGAGLLGALDPFIGLVERLWEERLAPNDLATPMGKELEQRKENGGRVAEAAETSRATASPRMMVRTRWFFKKENLSGLEGSLVIESGDNEDSGSSIGGVMPNRQPGGHRLKEEVIATMADDDLVLTNTADDNVVSTIIGKIRVVRRAPLEPEGSVDPVSPASKGAKGGTDRGKGAFVCRYDLSFHPLEKTPARKGAKGALATLRPCSTNGESCAPEYNVGGVPSSSGEGRGGTRDRIAASPHERGHLRPPPPLPLSPLSPRRLVSEGGVPAGGVPASKTKVGPEYQATIPALLDPARKTSFRGLANPPSQRIPKMVWNPETDCEGDDGAAGAVDGYLEEAASLILEHMKVVGLEPFLDANFVEAPDVAAEARKPREIDTDCLFTELHKCRGNIPKAIKKISANPGRYMTVWTAEDKERFDLGHRKYRDSLRMIARSLGDADGSKSCKDTVDYQYRFKIIENFRRFKRKTREKAEEIMENVDDRVFHENARAVERGREANGTTDVSTSDEDEDQTALPSTVTTLLARPARVGPVNPRVRAWSRTGGLPGADAVGAMQRRRNGARDLLLQVRERAGRNAYATLARSLTACSGGPVSGDALVAVRTTAQDVMKEHPALLEQFVKFMPKETV